MSVGYLRPRDRLAAAFTAGADRIRAGRVAELLDELELDADDLRDFSRRFAAGASPLDTPHSAAFTAGFVTALEVARSRRDT